MLRNLLEIALIALVAVGLLALQNAFGQSPLLHKVLILAACWGKTAFFVAEEMVQLRDATRRNLPYHLFMRLMLVNMFQIILSFGLDYYCLLNLNRSAFSVDEGLAGLRLLFECCYFSTLNFTFFGYGDITPQTVTAKLLAMTEIMLAFLTVIFLLSDFISLKESLQRSHPTGSDRNLPTELHP